MYQSTSADTDNRRTTIHLTCKNVELHTQLSTYGTKNSIEIAPPDHTYERKITLRDVKKEVMALIPPRRSLYPRFILLVCLFTTTTTFMFVQFAPSLSGTNSPDMKS